MHERQNEQKSAETATTGRKLDLSNPFDGGGPLTSDNLIEGVEIAFGTSMPGSDLDEWLSRFTFDDEGMGWLNDMCERTLTSSHGSAAALTEAEFMKVTRAYQALQLALRLSIRSGRAEFAAQQAITA